jgi:hypothetical protein
MRNGPEAKVQTPVKEYAQKKGWQWTKRSRSDPFGANGEPDGEFFRYPREIFFIEFKAPGKTSTAKQKHMQDRLRSCGFPVYECDNVEDGKKIVDFHTKHGTEAVMVDWE